jgi:hypothetical protein
MPTRTRKTQHTAPSDLDESRDYIEATRDFWQARTDRPLSREDAREMAHNLLGFFEVLREWTLAENRRTTQRLTAPTTEQESGQALVPVNVSLQQDILS